MERLLISTRITSDWTPTAGGAYGASGIKGRQLEVAIIEHFRDFGFSVTDHEDSRDYQVCGIDMTISMNGATTTVDIKNNMTKYGTFYVESWGSGWLHNTKKTSKLIVYGSASGDLCWYHRKDMINYLYHNDVYINEKRLYEFDRKLIDTCNFITRDKIR